MLLFSHDLIFTHTRTVSLTIEPLTTTTSILILAMEDVKCLHGYFFCHYERCDLHHLDLEKAEDIFRTRLRRGLTWMESDHTRVSLENGCLIAEGQSILGSRIKYYAKCTLYVNGMFHIHGNKCETLEKLMDDIQEVVAQCHDVAAASVDIHCDIRRRLCCIQRKKGEMEMSQNYSSEEEDEDDEADDADDDDDDVDSDDSRSYLRSSWDDVAWGGCRAPLDTFCCAAATVVDDSSSAAAAEAAAAGGGIDSPPHQAKEGEEEEKAGA